MERAEAAEGAAWFQWRKVAMKEHKNRKAEKKQRWTRTAKMEGSGVKSSEWLQASRRRQVCMMVKRMR